MRRAHKLSLHLHLNKEESISAKERRRTRPRGLPQTRYSLFITAAIRKAITFPIVGT
jgi:hypothetical protein